MHLSRVIRQYTLIKNPNLNTLVEELMIITRR